MKHETCSVPATKTALNALQDTKLFLAMSEEQSYALFAASKKVSLAKGDPLYWQEDSANYFYLVLSGWVKVFRETLDGDEAVIELAGSGSFVGEMAPLEGDVHSCNAAIAEDAVLLKLPTTLLADAVAKNHNVSLA